MGKLTAAIPFTELVERAALLARTTEETSRARVRGAINDYYARVLPGREDWTFLISNSSITTDPQYNTGTVSVNTQDTVVTFSTDASVTTAMTGRKIKFNSNSNIYDFTRTNGTGGTISPPLSGNTNVVSDGYVIFQPVYSLPGDFDRFPKNGGLQLVQGGRITILKEYRTQDYYRNYASQPGVPGNCRLVEAGTDGTQKVELIPPPKDSMVIPFEYLRTLDPLTQTSAGFIDISSASLTVTGSGGTTRFTEAQTGWYVRVNAFGDGEDSEWGRIISIANNSSATLQVAWGLSGATTAGYIISSVPQMPSKMHLAILYGGAKMLLSDQDDPQFQYLDRLERELMTEARKQYKTRIYDQEIDSIATDWNYRR